MRAAVGLAKALLLYHYDLTDTELRQVVQLSYQPPAAAAASTIAKPIARSAGCRVGPT